MQTTADGSLSESWESTEDLTTWTFNLRQGVSGMTVSPSPPTTWPSPSLVNNPESVTINTGILGDIGIVEGLKEYREGAAEDVSGITVVDENTIQFKLTAPDPRFPTSCAGPMSCPSTRYRLPVAEMREWDWWTTSPVGTGPCSPPTNAISTWNWSATRPLGRRAEAG